MTSAIDRVRASLASGHTSANLAVDDVREALAALDAERERREAAEAAAATLRTTARAYMHTTENYVPSRLMIDSRDALLAALAGRP